MPHQLEIKALLLDPEEARRRLLSLGATPLERLRQVDRYFAPRVDHPGVRIKVREIAGGETTYIVYERPDTREPSVSDYAILSASEGAALYGDVPPDAVVVRKSREVLSTLGVRTHLDDVEELGAFFELEALFSEERNEEACGELIGRITRELGDTLGERLAESYVDMARRRQARGTS